MTEKKAKTPERVDLPGWVLVEKDVRSRHVEAWFDEREKKTSEEWEAMNGVLRLREQFEMAISAGMVTLKDGYGSGDLTVLQKNQIILDVAANLSAALGEDAEGFNVGADPN